MKKEILWPLIGGLVFFLLAIWAFGDPLGLGFVETLQSIIKSQIMMASSLVSGMPLSWYSSVTARIGFLIYGASLFLGISIRILVIEIQSPSQNRQIEGDEFRGKNPALWINAGIWAINLGINLSFLIGYLLNATSISLWVCGALALSMAISVGLIVFNAKQLKLFDEIEE